MKFFKSLYLHPFFYWIISAIAVCSVLGFFYPILYAVARLATLLFTITIGFDITLVYRVKNGLETDRICPEKLSNGDQNPISIRIQNNYNFNVRIELIDDIPIQFQKRDFNYRFLLKPGKQHHINYSIRPVERGEYHFGNINVYASSFLKIIKRRYKVNANKMLPCYPSFMQMRKYELMAASNRLSDFGIKKIRRIGHQMEFDQIREYVKGDDYRTINWKATARKSQIMVNQYQDEKAQPIYSIIDCGRSMKMPFYGLSLLDYAINTSLVLSNTAILKHDKAGLLCFGKNVHTHLPAGGRRTQVKKIMELLYNQKTDYPEPNFELLYSSVKHFVKGRSLLMLYTNFESLDSMKRQLPYLQALAKNHLLVVVLFNNTEILKMTKQSVSSIEDIYIKTIGEKFLYDKKLIVKELEKYGIHAILTDPKNLSTYALNKYLELKSRGLI